MIMTFRLWPKQPNTEMTHSENWPKWPTYQVRNDPSSKLDETTQDKSTQDQNDPHSAVSHNLIPNKFPPMKLFPSFTEPVLYHIFFAFYVVDL